MSCEEDGLTKKIGLGTRKDPFPSDTGENKMWENTGINELVTGME